MLKVTVGDIVKEYIEGEYFSSIARDFQKYYENDILLVRDNWRLKELCHELKKDTELAFCTIKDPIGYAAYCRSLLFLLVKSFHKVVGYGKVNRLEACFKLDDGIYFETNGDFELNQELLNQVMEEMRICVDLDLPVSKESIRTEEVVDFFASVNRPDRANLLKYRRASRVNVYSIGGFYGYFYGYLVHSTGCLKVFNLKMYRDGFVLELPTSANPNEVVPFEPGDKIFDTYMDAERKGKLLGVSDIGSLNNAITNQGFNNVILMEEARKEKEIGTIAEKIAESGKRVVLIAGPSSSGKTTFSHRLSIQLGALGKNPHPLEVDNYFVNRVNTPKDEFGNYDFEAIECVDMEQLNKDVSALLRGERVEIPKYNFIRGEREYCGNYMQLGPDDVLVMEGIHCLNEKLTANISKNDKFKIFISAISPLNADDNNLVHVHDFRLLRRIIRDARTRGNNATATIKMWDSVRRGEKRNIDPFRDEADVIFNSSLLYEIAILKVYAEPLLFGVEPNTEEWLEAKRLLKFLDYCLAVSSEKIPNNSIIREFIGGSCFKV